MITAPRCFIRHSDPADCCKHTPACFSKIGWTQSEGDDCGLLQNRRNASERNTTIYEADAI